MKSMFSFFGLTVRFRGGRQKAPMPPEEEPIEYPEPSPSPMPKEVEVMSEARSKVKNKAKRAAGRGSTIFAGKLMKKRATSLLSDRL